MPRKMAIHGSAVAISLVLQAVVAAPVLLTAPTAWAEDHGDEGGGAHGGGPPPGKGGGHTEGGHEDEDHDDGTHGSGGQGSAGQGAGGQGAGGQGGGSRGAGGSGGGGRGGETARPAWAGGALPEVEIGRLNVARAPDQVLDRAYAEALSLFTAEVAEFYRLDVDSMVARLAADYRGTARLDSPVQNLALFRDALDGTSILADVGITTDATDLMGIFLGNAADMTLPVTKETAAATAILLGQPLSNADAQRVADIADRIRQARLSGHK